jgi:hypothetical protein
MNLSCLFGHSWRGCLCLRCGKVRDEGHNWRRVNKPELIDHPTDGVLSESDSACMKCPDCFRILPHKWVGCVCQQCGGMRHLWNGCKCGRCGGIRDYEHQLDGCKCIRCGSTIHDWHVKGEGKGAKFECRRCGVVGKCPECNGTGEVVCTHQSYYEDAVVDYVCTNPDCPECHGTHKMECPTCHKYVRGWKLEQIRAAKRRISKR